MYYLCKPFMSCTVLLLFLFFLRVHIFIITVDKPNLGSARQVANQRKKEKCDYANHWQYSLLCCCFFCFFLSSCCCDTSNISKNINEIISKIKFSLSRRLASTL